MKKRRMKVVRVTTTDIELEDGRIIPHIVELDTAPSVEDFQKYLNEWYDKMPVKEDSSDER